MISLSLLPGCKGNGFWTTASAVTLVDEQRQKLEVRKRVEHELTWINIMQASPNLHVGDAYTHLRGEVVLSYED